MNYLIIGHYGGRNFGDEAMLHALLSRISKRDNTNLTVVTKKRQKLYFSDKGVKYISPSPLKIIIESLKADVLILGGGTHFHDGYHSQRLKRHYIYLIRILLIYAFLRLLNKKIFQLGVGYGPHRGRLIQILSSLSLQLSTYTLVRDNASYQSILALNKDHENVDVAFDLVGVHPFFKKTITNARNKDDHWIGISISSLSFNEHKKADEFWLNHFVPLIRDFYQSQNLKIKIFVFRGGDRESDMELSKILYESLTSVDQTRVKFIDFTEDIISFFREINSCEKFIATRYHSALIAYLCSCELFMIPYHVKLLALAKDIKLSDIAIFGMEEPNENINDKLLTFLLDEKKRFAPSLPIENAINKSRKNLLVLQAGR